jgi:hypothetical protein
MKTAAFTVLIFLAGVTSAAAAGDTEPTWPEEHAPFLFVTILFVLGVWIVRSLRGKQTASLIGTITCERCAYQGPLQSKLNTFGTQAVMLCPRCQSKSWSKL